MTVLSVAVADLLKELVLSLMRGPLHPPATFILSFRGSWTPHQACRAVSRQQDGAAARLMWGVEAWPVVL